MNTNNAPSSLPKWYVSPDNQVRWVKELIFRHGLVEFSAEDIPKYPLDYVKDESRPTTEVLMLAIYLPDKDGVDGLRRTFDLFVKELKYRTAEDRWKFDARDFDGSNGVYRLRPYHKDKVKHQPGIRWVEYDPLRHPGVAINFVRHNYAQYDSQRLAGVETMQVASMFSGLRRRWTSRVRVSWRPDVLPAPYIGGIEVDILNPVTETFSDTWGLLPAFSRHVRRIGSVDSNRELTLEMMSCAGQGWHTLPTVREIL